MTTDAAHTAIATADWRRRVFALYDSVRAMPDPEVAHRLWRNGRDELMARHPVSPLLPEARADFRGLPVSDYDPAWRFEVQLEDAPADEFAFETGTDGTVRFVRVGVARIPEVGSLDVWRLTSYGGGLFVPVRDALAGREGGTYGGGRYLIDTIKGADLGADAEAGTLVLDFNFAYNPSCAYDPAWACPLPPAGNTVTTEIPAGERY